MVKIRLKNAPADLKKSGRPMTVMAGVQNPLSCRFEPLQICEYSVYLPIYVIYRFPRSIVHPSNALHSGGLWLVIGPNTSFRPRSLFGFQGFRGLGAWGFCIFGSDPYLSLSEWITHYSQCFDCASCSWSGMSIIYIYHHVYICVYIYIIIIISHIYYNIIILYYIILCYIILNYIILHYIILHYNIYIYIIKYNIIKYNLI